MFDPRGDILSHPKHLPPTDRTPVEPDWPRPLALVVTRDLAEMRLLRRALEKLGMDVLLAVNAGLAVELYREHRPDVAAVFVALGQLTLDTDATLTALRAVSPGLRCCLVAGDEPPARPPPGPLIRQPFVLTEIAAAVRQLLRRD